MGNGGGALDRSGLDRLLQTGEAVVWTGEPNSHRFLSKRQGWAIAIWSWWLVVSVAIAPALWNAPIDAWDFFALLALVFLVIETSRLGPWLFRRFGETYVLTSRRILILNRDDSVRSETSLLRTHEFTRVAAPEYLDTLVLGEDQPLLRGRSIDTRSAADAARLSAVAGGDDLLSLIRKTATAWETEWGSGIADA